MGKYVPGSVCFRVNDFFRNRGTILLLIASCLTCVQTTAFGASQKSEDKLTMQSAVKDAPVPPVGAIAKPTKPTTRLQGKAEVTISRDNDTKVRNALSQYKAGVKALNKRDYRLAADCFMRSGDAVESLSGTEKFLAQARFAEAQSRRLAGQKNEAAALYQIAVDLFEEYDPLNSYLKAALDNLKQLAPQLRGKVSQSEARLALMINPTRIVMADRNVLLKGGINNFGIHLADPASANLDTEDIRKTVYKAFLEMTCIETVELGSNSITAKTRWLPLLANGQIVTVSASSDLLTPTISVKLNGRFYNVPVNLPGLSANRRTVYLLTDGSNIIAIDPARETVWLLMVQFKGHEADFSWKELEHHKDKAM